MIETGRVDPSHLPELRPGDAFAGRYRIERLLGEGDRKRTYLVWDTKMDGRVALAVVKPDAVPSDPNGTEREARVLGRIGNHANIVTIHDYDVSGGVQYMVFEHLEEGTLEAHIKKTGPLPIDELLRLGRQVSRALAHLHGKGVLHRDVSPGNVWLDRRRTAHLGDFDSAVAVGDATGARPPTTNAFAAPEERQGGPIDGRSDLFSLGGLLFVAATGSDRPGYRGRLRELRPDLPSSFGDLVESLMAASPEDRPQDAGAVLERLDDVRHASNVDALIADGEGDRVEFKASFLAPYGAAPLGVGDKLAWLRDVRSKLEEEVTKTIAAFLNAGGGTLLIGVSDTGEVVGVEADFEALAAGKRDWDHWVLTLGQAVKKSLGEEAWATVRVSGVRRETGTVAVLSCPARNTETWHGQGDKAVFYLRCNNESQRLAPPAAARYIREHWPV